VSHAPGSDGHHPPPGSDGYRTAPARTGTRPPRLPPHRCPMSPATPETGALLARAAGLRARGLSWEATADKLHLTEDELRTLADHPDYRRLLAAARREA